MAREDREEHHEEREDEEDRRERNRPQTHTPPESETLTTALEVAQRALRQAEAGRQDLERVQRELRMERELREEGMELLHREERRSLMLAHELRTYQRALGEQAESLAEERARRLALELAAAEKIDLTKTLDDHQAPMTSLIASSENATIDKMPTLVGNAKQLGWGRRIKRWFLGERTG